MGERKDDHRSSSNRAAERRVIALCQDGAVVLGLGAGPFRPHARMLILNIERLPNVDVVGDAHRLPLADNSIDAVHCEAVFEHLRDPQDAAAELHRVMKPRAIGYICTPFMQAFHGYPSHYQNYTREGHRRLFERAGFHVIARGSGTGPAWAVSSIVATFIAHYAPAILRWPMRAGWYVFSAVFVKPLDRILAERDDAFVVASTTYVLVKKVATDHSARIASGSTPMALSSASASGSSA